MKAEYQEYFSSLEAKGIREFDTYNARVRNQTSKGCWLSVEGTNNDIFLNANYPVATELQISFNINPKRQRYYPVVETVLHYGYDRVEPNSYYSVA